MRSRRAGAAGLLGALLPVLSQALLGSCASNPTPSHLRRSAKDAITSGEGAYARVELRDGGIITGELIAAKPARLTILTDRARLGTVAFDDVHELTLGVHDNDVGAFALWSGLGTLSTISHGLFLFISAPVWLATSIPSTVNESYRGLYLCRSDARAGMFEGCLRYAGVYARFPQGLPPGVGEDQVLGKVQMPPATPPPRASSRTDAESPADGGVNGEGAPPDAALPPGFPTPYDPAH